MVCVCFCCAGHGFCSNLLSIVVSITFTFHAVGITSFHWMCEGVDCTPAGLYYNCDGDGCVTGVQNASILTLCLIVLISNFILIFVLCCILHCSDFRWQSMTPSLAIFIGGWYAAQEILTTAVLITLAVKYENIGWSAYVFTVPGIILLAIVILVLIYMMCKPEHRVFPNSKA